MITRRVVTLPRYQFERPLAPSCQVFAAGLVGHCSAVSRQISSWPPLYENLLKPP